MEIHGDLLKLPFFPLHNGVLQFFFHGPRKLTFFPLHSSIAPPAWDHQFHSHFLNRVPKKTIGHFFMLKWALLGKRWLSCILDWTLIPKISPFSSRRSLLYSQGRPLEETRWVFLCQDGYIAWASVTITFNQCVMLVFLEPVQ